jgi:hypothetical protein
MGLYSIKGARRNKGVEVAFSVSQLFMTSHNSSEVQVVPDNNFESPISETYYVVDYVKGVYKLYMLTTFGERK